MANDLRVLPPEPDAPVRCVVRRPGEDDVSGRVALGETALELREDRGALGVGSTRYAAASCRSPMSRWGTGRRVFASSGTSRSGPAVRSAGTGARRLSWTIRQRIRCSPGSRERRSGHWPRSLHPFVFASGTRHRAEALPQGCRCRAPARGAPRAFATFARRRK